MRELYLWIFTITEYEEQEDWTNKKVWEHKAEDIIEKYWERVLEILEEEWYYLIN